MTCQSEFLKVPPRKELETDSVRQKAEATRRALGDLDGRVRGFRGGGIPLGLITLLEAKASSEIEGIVVTHGELYRADVARGDRAQGFALEVLRNRSALLLGFEGLGKSGNRITNDGIVSMFRELLGTGDGFRTRPGTVIGDAVTGEVVYRPPEPSEVPGLMSELEALYNDEGPSGMDPLVKMALLHHHYESVHPFYDGNGRTGRILNVLCLVREGLLSLPVMYHSHYINNHRGNYYRLLGLVRDVGGEAAAWREWVVFMLEAVEDSSRAAIKLLGKVEATMRDTGKRMRRELPGMHSQELLESLFAHPCTNASQLADDLGVPRTTAANHLEALADCGFLDREEVGREAFFGNDELVCLLAQVADRNW